MNCLLLFVVLLSLSYEGNAHNSYYGCDRVALDTGLMVMGEVTAFSADRVMQVSRNGVQLTSGDTFDPGEVLTVSMSVTTGEMLLEVTGGAQFTGGDCDGQTRFAGGSTDVTMGADDANIWGGWASTKGVVLITAKFLLVSSGNPFPTTMTTSSPTSLTTSSPTSFVEDVATFSLAFKVATTGVTSADLQKELTALEDVFCTYLSLAPSLCYTTFVSDSEGTTNELQFDVLVTAFASQADANGADTSLQQYVLDITATGFIEEFFTASDLRFTAAAYQSSEVTESSISDSLAFSCSLSDSLKLSWRVNSQGDGSSIGEAGGYITGTLTMLSDGSTWFAAGVVTDGSLTMVSSPEHVVYFYEPNSQQAGMYKINAESSSGIVPDNRIRADTGVTGKHSAQTSTSINFQQSRFTDVAVDPVLALDSEADYNTILWGHGGVWPDKHASANRGFATVYWLEGACVAAPESDVDTVKWFFLAVLILLLVGIIVVQLDRTSFRHWKVTYHFSRTLRQLLPTYIPLTHDIAAFSLRSMIAMSAYIAIVAIFLKKTADFYEDEKGYDTDRAYSFSLGYGALFSAALTIIPVNKTGIIVTLFRVPFDRATKFHRICGALTMLLVLVHAIQIIDFWGSSEVLHFDTSKEVGNAQPAYGLLAACCFGAMALTAPYPMRSRAYELFQLAHCLFFPAMVFIILHIPENGKIGKILIGPLILYGLDVIYCSFQKVLPVENKSISSPYSKYTVLKVTAKHIENIQPGQYCLVNIAQASFFQWHPISICSYDRETHELTFIIKNVGDWTAKICDVVNSAAEEGQGDTLKVRLTGTYGRIRFDIGADPESNTYPYEKLILVAGGIGCTPMISTLQWLIDNANDRGNERRLHVTVLITARDREMFSLFGDFFKKFNDSKVFQEGGIDLRLYCTTTQRPSQVDNPGANSLEIQTLRSSDAGTSEMMGPVANLTVPITYSRPDLGMEIETVCECRESTAGRVCVLVCGPAGIVNAVQKGCHAAVNKFGPVLDLHEESFRL